ncbi:hypothetical protein DIPPA_30343 [Diplonema papillatum]|nr:hypothetical protein DIPPA_30343 [Diplonema papillatum]
MEGSTVSPVVPGLVSYAHTGYNTMVGNPAVQVGGYNVSADPNQWNGSFQAWSPGYQVSNAIESPYKPHDTTAHAPHHNHPVHQTAPGSFPHDHHIAAAHKQGPCMHCSYPAHAMGGFGLPQPAPTPLDILHSLAGDWEVSDLCPPDDTFTGLKIHADGTFHCTAGRVRRGQITVTSTNTREVQMTGVCGDSFVLSVTPGGGHMAGTDVRTNMKWHLEKRSRSAAASQASSAIGKLRPERQASFPASSQRRMHPRLASSSLSSDPSSTSEMTRERLQELLRKAWKEGRASAVGSNESSNSSKNTLASPGQPLGNGLVPIDGSGTAFFAAANSVFPLSQGKPLAARNQAPGFPSGAAAAYSIPTTPTIDPLLAPAAARGFYGGPPTCESDQPPAGRQHQRQQPPPPCFLNGKYPAGAAPQPPPPREEGESCLALQYAGQFETPPRSPPEDGLPARDPPSSHCPVFGVVKIRRMGTDAMQRELSKQILLCRDAGSVAALVEQAKAQFDPNAVCLSSAAHRVARLNGAQEEPRNAIFDAILTDVTTHGLAGWDAQAICKVLWACATAGYKNTDFFDAAEDFVHHEGLALFRAQHLAYLVWAFAATGHKATALFEKVDAEIVKRGLSGFNSQDICMCLKGFATAGHKAAAVFRASEAEVGRRGLSAFNAHEVVNVLASFAAVGNKYRVLLSAVDGHRDLEGFTAQGLAAVLRSVAVLVANEGGGGAEPDGGALLQGFFDAVEDEVSERVTRGALPLQYLSAVAWAFARAGRGQSSVFEASAVVLRRDGTRGLSGPELVCLSSAHTTARPHHETTVEVMREVCHEVKKRGGLQQNSADAALLLTCIAGDAGCHPAEAVAACGALAKGLNARKLRFFKDGELVTAVKTLSAMRACGEAFSKKSAVEVARRGVRTLEAPQLRDLALAFSKINPSSTGAEKTAIFALIGREVDRRHTRVFSPGDLATLAFTLADSGQFPPALKCISEAFRRPSSAFEPCELADLVQACHLAQVDPDPLLKKVELDVKAKGFIPFGRHAATVALLFFSCIAPGGFQSSWLSLRAWVPLPPQWAAPESLSGALAALGYAVKDKFTVGRLSYALALPELRVVVEVLSPELPDYSTTAVLDLKKAALNYEGWALAVVDWDEKAPKRQQKLEETVTASADEAKTLRPASASPSSVDPDEEGSSNEAVR